MPIAILPTALVSSSAASGTKAVPDPDRYWIHRFYVTISAAATVRVQASYDGSTYRDLTAAPTTASGLVIIDRAYRYLRVEWSGNTGTVTVELEQLGSSPVGML